MTSADTEIPVNTDHMNSVKSEEPSILKKYDNQLGQKSPHKLASVDCEHQADFASSWEEQASEVKCGNSVKSEDSVRFEEPGLHAPVNSDNLTGEGIPETHEHSAQPVNNSNFEDAPDQLCENYEHEQNPVNSEHSAKFKLMLKKTAAINLTLLFHLIAEVPLMMMGLININCDPDKGECTTFFLFYKIVAYFRIVSFIGQIVIFMLVFK